MNLSSTLSRSLSSLAAVSVVAACGSSDPTTSGGGSDLQTGAATTGSSSSTASPASGVSSSSGDGAGPTTTSGGGSSEGGGGDTTTGQGGEGGAVASVGQGGEGGAVTTVGQGGGGAGPGTGGAGPGAGGAAGDGGGGMTGQGGSGGAGVGTSNASSTSTGGEVCDVGFDDCDNDPLNGCETPIDTLIDCGACDAPCDLTNADSVCNGGACELGACDAGFDDCDDNDVTGCEANLASNNHCGVCDNACELGWSCVTGDCMMQRAIDISGGDSSACAVLETGAIHCWGTNGDGRLGDATLTSSSVPVAVLGVANATGVSVGWGHACATRSTGGVACWGDNGAGQLGNGSLTPSALAVAVVGVSDAVDVAADQRHTCALRAGGTVACWGRNVNGELGNATTVNSTLPVQVSGLTDAVSITVGNRHSCATRATGAVVCWGGNDAGQLGGNGNTSSSVPVTVLGLANVVSLSAGSAFTCAVRSEGSIQCWGANVSAIASDTVTDAVTVSAGNSATCALRAGGEVRCWGFNGRGELARGTTISSLDIAAPVQGWGGTLIDDVTQVDMNYGNCLIRNDGEVWCAGNGMTLGDGQMVSISGLPSEASRWYMYPVRGRAARAFEDGDCTNGIDDDEDGVLDCDDPDCATDAGSAVGAGVILDAMDGRSALHYESACNTGSNSQGREKRHLWTAPAAGTYEFIVTSPSMNTTLTVEEGGCGAVLACNDDGPGLGLNPRVAVTLQAGEVVGLLVDSWTSPDNAPYSVSINPI